MSETDPFDLVCRSRRELLPEEAHQRLMGGSMETRLMTLMLNEFERESRLQAGDELVVARMAARATKASRIRMPRHVRMHTWLLAAALAFVGAVACAYWVVAPNTVRPKPAATSESPGSKAKSGGGAPGPSIARTTEAEEPPVSPDRGALPVIPAPLSPPNLYGESGTTAVVPALVPSTRLPSLKARASGDGPSNPRLKPRDGDDDGAADRTPAALFARANSLRRGGRSSEALGLYQTILDKFPSAREAPPARLALAKLLEGSNPTQALAHYRLLAQRKGTLRAEGLWGLAETARNLGQSALEQRTLSELVREFPNSPYAAVARERMQDDIR
jgi:hypothetical protein